jgi:hypothetical protein
VVNIVRNGSFLVYELTVFNNAIRVSQGQPHLTSVADGAVTNLRTSRSVGAQKERKQNEYAATDCKL